MQPTESTLPARIHLGAVPIHILRLDSALARLDQLVESKSYHYACFCESNLFIRAINDPAILRILENASLVLPDGFGVVLGARLLGGKVPEQLHGPKIMFEYCRYGAAKARKHFFYGGNAGVPELLAKRLQEKIPGLNVVGTYSPPFRDLTFKEEHEVKKIIEASKADVLWVGLGAPKQEIWMADHVGKIDVRLMLGVGAAFDFHSGARKWAPFWVRKAGLIWLFRMCTGGQRIFLRNADCVSRFFIYILREVVRKSNAPKVKGSS